MRRMKGQDETLNKTLKEDEAPEETKRYWCRTRSNHVIGFAYRFRKRKEAYGP